MKFQPIETGLCLALAAVAGLTAMQAAGPIAPAHSKSWQLVQTFHGDEFAIDSGLSLGDCVEAMPENQAAKGLSFACEVER